MNKVLKEQTEIKLLGEIHKLLMRDVPQGSTEDTLQHNSRILDLTQNVVKILKEYVRVQ